MKTPSDAHAGIQWLVLGVLTADNRFIRRPGLAKRSDFRAALDPKSPFRVELFDTGGRLLLRAGIPLHTPCSDGPGADPALRLVAGTVPFPVDTAVVRFFLEDVLLEEFTVPEGEPRTQLTDVPESGSRGRTRLAWQSTHPGHAPLSHVAGFSADDGKTWQPIGAASADTSLEFDLDALPGGERCRLCVHTTDGVHTVAAISDPIRLPVKACVAMILAPESGARIAPGSVLRLQGQGFWLEEGRAELEALEWSSSVAGPLGRGAHVEIELRSPGRHEITLVAGHGERVGRATIDVLVVD